MKLCEKEHVKRLSKMTNDMLKGKKMIKSRRRRDLIPIYKGKRDVRLCGNYRSV